MEKKVRFGDLVRNAGRPQAVTLWTDPRKDRSFTEAVRQNRVLTVIQKPTSQHADFGRIGFHEQPHASYLKFPRALPNDHDSRVIGINYQLLDEREVARPVRSAGSKSKKPPAKPKPVEKTFRIKLRRIATLESEVSVKAPDRKTAEKQAVESLKGTPFNPEEAAVRDEIVAVE